MEEITRDMIMIENHFTKELKVIEDENKTIQSYVEKAEKIHFD